MNVTKVVAPVCVAVLLLLSGCAWSIWGRSPSDELTPVAVPENSSSNNSESLSYDTTYTAGSESSRIFGLRPTCDRPPELVVHIQVLALSQNQPNNNQGINTTWQFAAPSNRELTGPYPNFVRIIRSQYQPLLDAEKIEYGPTDRSNSRATIPVTVADSNGTSRTYRWVVTKQTEAPYDGCWMTTSVSPDIQSRRGVATDRPSSLHGTIPNAG